MVELEIFPFPNKNQGETNEVKLQTIDGYKRVPAKKAIKADISKMPITPYLMEVFSNIRLGKNYRFVYKNAYDLAFGISHKDYKSYKCYLSHHKTNGDNSLTLNNRTSRIKDEKKLPVLDLFYDYIKINNIEVIHEIPGQASSEGHWAAFEVKPTNTKWFIHFSNIVFGDEFNGNLKIRENQIQTTNVNQQKAYDLVKEECIKCYLRFKNKSRFTPTGNIIKCMGANATKAWPTDWKDWIVENASAIIKGIEIDT